MDPRVKRGLAVDEYIAKHPIVESASFASHSGGHTVVKARLSTASYKTQSKTYYNQNFYLPSTKDDNVCGTIEGPMESASEEVKMSSSSKCSSWTVNFRATDINGKKKRFVDVLNAQSGLYDQVDVTDIHSDFLSGDHWGNPVWLPTSGSGHASPRILAYMAEQHPPNWKDDDKRE